MSNITKAKNNLKQKLSLNDYIAPVSQRTGKPVSKQSDKYYQPKQISKAHCKDRISNRESKTSIPASHFAGRDEKIKATYYLSKDDNQALLDIFIKRLQEQKKVDKSALIAEAIRLLYKREVRGRENI